MKKPSSVSVLLLAIVAMLLFAGPIAAVVRPAAYVPTGTGYTKITAGVQATAAATINLASTAEVGGVLTGANGGAGWTTAYDQDFTALSGPNTVSGNGNQTVGAYTYTSTNQGNSQTFTIGGTNGIRIRGSTTNSTMTPASRTGPCLTTPALTTWITTGDTSNYALRVSLWIKSRTLTNNNDTVDFFVDTGSNNQRYEYDVFNSGGTATEYMRMLVNNATRMTGASIGAVIASHDSFQMEIVALGADYVHLRSGIYSSGFPSVWSHRGNIGAASGAHVNPLMRTLGDARVSLCVETNNTSGTAEASFGRLKVEYRSLQ